MRTHVIYSGRVQGVGFRYTAQSIARDLGLTGWVKNRRDGTVELLAEGTEEKLKELLGSIEQDFSSSIRDAEATWSEATGEFADFSVTF